MDKGNGCLGDFAKEVLQEKPKGIYKIYGEGLYLLPEGTPKLEKLRVLRTGWMLGTLKRGGLSLRRHLQWDCVRKK